MDNVLDTNNVILTLTINSLTLHFHFAG